MDTSPRARPERESLTARVRRSPTTATLVGVCVVASVAMELDPDDRIFEAFAKVGERVRAGELWRLFTASFLHAGILHLWINGASLASIGPPIERVYGRLRFLAIFLLGGAAGMAASVVLVPLPSLGASAGVFALLGALLAYALRSRARLPPRVRRLLIVQSLVIAALNLAFGFAVRFIDNAAHVGGLAGGLVLGLVLRPRRNLFDPPAAPPAPAAVPPPSPGGSPAGP